MHGKGYFTFVNKKPELQRGYLTCLIFIYSIIYFCHYELMNTYFILGETGVFFIEEKVKDRM